MKLHYGNALGVFLVALSTLILEIALTRVFSVILWYHFGSLAIALAMFGIGASGVLIYVFPKLFPKEKLGRQLSTLCTLFGISIAVCFYIVLKISFVPNFSLSSLLTLVVLYTVTAIPFFLSGLCIALIFTHRPTLLGKLYFMDLLGAGLGCMVAVGIMSLVSAPNSIIVASILASFGGLAFSAADKSVSAWWSGIVAVLLFALLVVNMNVNVFRLNFVKGEAYLQPEYERWNSYAYIGVWDQKLNRRPFGWGMSRTWRGSGAYECFIKIDADAGTVITEFSGDLSRVEYLSYDVTSIVHYLLDDHKVLIIGAGGGRDILAALSMGADSIYALEYNKAIVETVSDQYSEFSGEVYDLPKVHKIIAEGRNYVQRSGETFDLIQASLVDSWAANASGAYVMAENFLYTKEAFSIFFDHLSDHGMLSVSRYNLAHTPQLLRVASTALEVLQTKNISQPTDHLMVVTKDNQIGTVILGKEPFSAEQVQIIKDESERLKFTVAWAPGIQNAGPISDFLTADVQEFLNDYLYDISAPTDDKPFFFHMAKSVKALRHMMRSTSAQLNVFNVKWYGTYVLAAVLAIATTLAVLCILLPLYLKRASLRGVKRKKVILGYFACLGVGFMFIEIPLMQRLTLFLGHPVYALSIVLFSLLVFAGWGSFFTSRMQKEHAASYLKTWMLVLLAVLLLTNFLVPLFINYFIVLSLASRIILTILLLAPLGILIGMPLPLGMRVFAGESGELVPWVWGINGACSVFASLFALALAMTFGFSRTTMTGIAIYVLAYLLVRSFSKKGVGERAPTR